MSDLVLYKWRVYCETESSYEYWWLDENQATPTTCPNDSGHTITTSFTKIVDRRDSETVKIKQELIQTGEHYQWSTFAFDALADQITTYSFSYPIPVSGLEARFISHSENTGDIWSWSILPDTVVGTITSDVVATDTVINVSSTVTDNVKIGYYVNLYDGVNTDVLNRVTAIDAIAGTITVETAATQGFLAATPTYVRMTIYFMKDAEIGHPWSYVYGEGKIQSTHIPANIAINVSYDNKSKTIDKRIAVSLETLY